MRAAASWRRTKKAYAKASVKACAEAPEAAEEGEIFSVTSVRPAEGGGEIFLALIDTGDGRLLGQVIAEEMPPIGAKVSPTLRMMSKGPPIEYGFKWVLKA